MARRAPKLTDPALKSGLRRAMAAGALGLRDVCRVLRAEHGMTQLEFARVLGVGVNVIKGIESGRGNPTLDSVARIADLAGLALALVEPSSPKVALVSSAALEAEQRRARRRTLRPLAEGERTAKASDAENAFDTSGLILAPVKVPL